jgi:hypothetical protein
MKTGFWSTCTLCLALVLALAGCGGGHTKRIVVAPDYQPEYAVIFDDRLVPELFGMNLEGRDPVEDPKLRERTLRSDLVMPARVETVSRLGGVEDKGAYEIVFGMRETPLYGAPPTEPLTVNVGVASPTYAWVDSAGARWVGTRLILFAKRFKGPHGDVLHFHGEPDTQAMREVVHRHLAVRVLPQGH